MARPRKEGMDYYPHDTDASNDEKIEAMRSIFGNDGYAFYFILLERIYRTDRAEIDISKRVFKMALVTKTMVDEQKFDEMLEAAIELNLFDENSFRERSVLTSRGIQKRFSEVKNMRERWRKKKDNQAEIVVFQGENKEENAEENDEETGESKAKQSKANNKESIYVVFDFWNSKKIITHKGNPTPQMEFQIRRRMKDYTQEEIIESISNYADILHGDGYILTTKWKLDDFLEKHIEKFLTINNPFDSYRKWPEERSKSNEKPRRAFSGDDFDYNSLSL